MSSYEKISKVDSSEKLDIIFTIVSRGKGETVVDFLREIDVPHSTICHGRGTAPSAILELLGLGVTEKDVVLTVVKNEQSAKIIRKISKKMDFAKPGHGITFTVPIQSVAGIMGFKFLTTDSFEEE